jgi:hypothetical protein
MDMIFESFESITPTENHIKQLHGVLLKYSKKDQDHRGHYKIIRWDFPTICLTSRQTPIALSLRCTTRIDSHARQT